VSHHQHVVVWGEWHAKAPVMARLSQGFKAMI
jgi:hypothetical protein